MKIGIFAGTFDPIHNGHIAFAQTAVAEAALQKVIVVAEKNPYRKRPHVSWDHRQAMIERAVTDIDAADHDYAFANQLAKQHTMLNVLEVAQKHYGEENEFWFLVGSDTFEHMHKWQDIVAKHMYGGFVVALRREHTTQWLEQRMDQLKSSGLDFHYVVVSNMYHETNSSAIRAALTQKNTEVDLPESVAKYIETHELYLSGSSE